MSKKYEHSGKVDWSKAGIWFLAGLIGSGIVGAIYGVLSDINPLIYLHILLLFGVVFAMVFVLDFVINKGHIRNRLVAVGMALIFGIFAWYCGWCSFFSYQTGISFFSFLPDVSFTIDTISYYSENVDMTVGRRGSQIPVGSIMPAMYLIELVAFLAPIYLIAKRKYYYCEGCKENMSQSTIYTADIDAVTQNMDSLRSGNALFVKDLTPISDPSLLNDIYKAYQFDFHHCEKCQSVVYNLKNISLKKDKKGKMTVADRNDLITGLYLDKESSESILPVVKQPSFSRKKFSAL